MEKYSGSNNLLYKHQEQKTSSLANFDVENFYPSILIDLFTDAISYTKTITNIDDDPVTNNNTVKKNFTI